MIGSNATCVRITIVDTVRVEALLGGTIRLFARSVRVGMLKNVETIFEILILIKKTIHMTIGGIRFLKKENGLGTHFRTFNHYNSLMINIQ